MKKLERRTLACVGLLGLLILGMSFFVFRLFTDGGKWATFYANQHVYEAGVLSVGEIYDRNGVLLVQNTPQGRRYNDDEAIRLATFQLLGDDGGNVSTGLLSVHREKLVNYSFVNGTTAFFNDKGNRLDLTIDANISKAAWEALNGRNGTVAVYNRLTGEIVTCVSAPSMDLAKDAAEGETLPSGTYMNKALIGLYTPGSVFKLLTAQAALEKKADIDGWVYSCRGSISLGEGRITCSEWHGEVGLKEALQCSCNCAFAELAAELGAETMAEYTKKAGLETGYDIDGMRTETGRFDFGLSEENLGWSGVGQGKDMINPLSMLIYVGSIAGEGTTAKPRILGKKTIGKAEVVESSDKVTLMDAATARKLKEMMRNNVVEDYGDGNYPGLELCAKTGTAQTDEKGNTNALMVGFSGDFVFFVCVEGGRSGAGVAGPVVNEVMQLVRQAYG